MQYHKVGASKIPSTLMVFVFLEKFTLSQSFTFGLTVGNCRRSLILDFVKVGWSLSEITNMFNNKLTI